MRALLVALLAALLAAPVAHAAVPAGNLVKNPGADGGPGDPDSSGTNRPPFWGVNGSLSAVQYGAPDFLTQADGQALGGLPNFFAGGNDAVSTGSQFIDVSGAAAEIDAGNLVETLSADIGGFASQDDSATITATALNGAGGPLGAIKIGPVTAADRGSVTKLLPRSASGALPAGTRQIEVLMEMDRVAGSYNDGYVDNVSLTLGGGVPEFHRTVVVQVVSGTVLVKVPGSNAFVPVTGSQGVPLGSTVDTRHGKLALTSVPKAGGKPQTADFYDGEFKVTQPGAITQLALVEPLAACGHKAGAAASKPKSRKLWGDGSGSFRTRGQYSAATVRGTKWLVQDTCAGTLTRVVKGLVAVQDFRRHRTVLVRAGHRYLAKPA
jgi:hypothetical protein